jgi:uncharacterized membrane protein
MKRIIYFLDIEAEVFYFISVLIISFVLAELVIGSQTQLFRKTLSIMCHQRPEKCFLVFGHKLALCSRCMGLYFGFVFAFKLINRLRRFRLIIVLSLCYFAVDILLELVFRVPVSNAARFFSGFCVSYSLIHVFESIKTPKQIAIG